MRIPPKTITQKIAYLKQLKYKEPLILEYLCCCYSGAISTYAVFNFDFHYVPLCFGATAVFYTMFKKSLHNAKKIDKHLKYLNNKNTK